MGQGSAKNVTVCSKCEELVKYDNENTYWDYSCIGFNIKVTRCSHCGNIIVLDEEEIDLDINNNPSYF